MSIPAQRQCPDSITNPGKLGLLLGLALLAAGAVPSCAIDLRVRPAGEPALGLVLQL